MANIEEVRVFIASPSDVEEERDAVERVIERVNRTVAGLQPIRLLPIRWETAVQPAIGGDAQHIVNSELAGEYEVFIGILWTRFGTPTPRSDSGTLEEFEAVVARHKKDPSSVSVMFYFKDAPSAPMDIDPEQLQKVQEFRKKYKDIGIYGTFTDTSNFEQTLQINLTRLAIDWQKRIRQVNAIHLSTPVVAVDESDRSGESRADPLPPQEPDDDQGLLDLVEEGKKGFGEVTAIAERLTNHLQTLAASQRRGTQELDAAKDKSGNTNTSKAKEIINSVADEMDGIATGIQAEVIPFKRAYGKAINAYGRAASLLVDFGGNTSKQIEGAISTTSTLEQEISKSQEALRSLKESIASQPRVTSKYNKVKRKILEVLGELDREMSAARTSTKQVLQLFEEL